MRSSSTRSRQRVLAVTVKTMSAMRLMTWRAGRRTCRRGGESHSRLPATDFILDELGHLGDRADLVEHQHRFVRRRAGRSAPPRRHRQCGSTCELPIVRIVVVLQFCSWSACRITGRRARVDRFGCSQLGHLEQHVQEVASEAEIVVGIDVGAADAVAGPGGDARHLRDRW